MTIYNTPQEHGLEQIACIDYSSGDYCFDYRVAWKRLADRKVLSGRDSGCSCPSPFESISLNDLQEVESIGWLKEEIQKDGQQYLSAADAQSFLEKVDKAIEEWKAGLTRKERKSVVGIGLTLGKLIDALEECDANKVMPKGFGKPHSWRGIYEELAFEPVEDITIGEMLKTAKSAVGKSFQGYKGGDFTMTRETEVHVSFEGESYDYLGDILLHYMVGAPMKERCEGCNRWYKKPIAEAHTRVQCLEYQLEDAKAQEKANKKKK